MLKRFLALGLAMVLLLCTGEPMFAATSNTKLDQEKLYEAYIVFSNRLDDMDISASICVEDFISGYTWDTEEMLEQYIDELVEKEIDTAEEFGLTVQANSILNVENNETNAISGEAQPRASLMKWYDNIGTTSPKLPQKASYDKYSLRTMVKKGDIVEETFGLVAAITGHIAIVEGEFYDSTYKQFYLRTIEAGPKGVVRGVLDDNRIAERGVTMHYVTDATDIQKKNAVEFCASQLGKPYGLGIPFTSCEYKSNTEDWYCTELVWAAYYNSGINLNGGIIPFNIFMPSALGGSYKLSLRRIS